MDTTTPEVDALRDGNQIPPPDTKTLPLFTPDALTPKAKDGW